MTLILTVISRVQIWEEIEKKNRFRKKMEKALKEILYIGDGAFKVTIDTDGERVSDPGMVSGRPGRDGLSAADRLQRSDFQDAVQYQGISGMCSMSATGTAISSTNCIWMRSW